MSELINEKDVLVALGKGKSVQYKYNEPHKSEWLDLRPSGWCLTDFLEEDFLGKYLFRLKPRTITINGIEVPAPDQIEKNPNLHGGWAINIGTEYYMYKSESNYNIVVAALRSVFGKK